MEVDLDVDVELDMDTRVDLVAVCMNPALDITTSTAVVRPTDKLRCAAAMKSREAWSASGVRTSTPSRIRIPARS